MVKRIKKLVITTILFFCLIFNVKASTQDEIRKGLIETAQAYYRQKAQLQYDSYRKNLNSTPEDATSQHTTYTVCSGFTYQVYNQTLGIEIPDTTEELINYAIENKENKSLVIALYEGKDKVYSKNALGTSSQAIYTNLIKKWVSILKPGDIIVVTGHAMMVESVNKTDNTIRIMESAYGTRYDYTNHVDKYDENGTVKYTDLADRLKSYYNYIKRDKTLIENMAVIRFVYKDDQYSLTPSAKSRLKYDNIDIAKVVEIKSSEESFKQSVLTNLGETITYTIKIYNKGKAKYKSFTIEETLDPKVKLIDAGGATVSGNKLKWTVSSMAVDTDIVKKYTVQVKNDKSNLGKIIVSTGKEDNIATTRVETLIGNRFISSEKEKVKKAFNSNKSNSKTEKDFINQIYKDAFKIDLGLSNSIKNTDIIGYSSSVRTGGGNTLSVKTTKIKNNNLKKYIYNNFYGLEIGEKNNSSQNIVRATLQWNIYATNELNDRARTITKNMLYDGDIILVNTYNSSNKLVNKSYIYINGVLYRKTAANKFEEKSGTTLTEFLRNMVGLNYIILRPSIVLDEEIANLNKPVSTPTPSPTPKPNPTPDPEPTIKPEQEKPNPGTGTGSTTQQENPTKPSTPTTKPSTPTTKPTTPTVKPETKPEQNIENVPDVEEPEEEYIPADESIVEEDDKYEELQKRVDEELEKKFLKMDLIMGGVLVVILIGMGCYMFSIYGKKLK